LPGAQKNGGPKAAVLSGSLFDLLEQAEDVLVGLRGQRQSCG
jgi:hypothetical protein